jgi:5-methylcytosine-specific restriction protein A
MRGVRAKNHSKIKMESAVDDLSDVPKGNHFPDRAKVVTQVTKRDNQVRKYVLKRAKGKCEYCGVQGFTTTNGGFYIETHHIIALCDSGRDTVDNVIALCPQHHRQAHYGIDAESLEAEFVARLKELNKR